MSGRLAGRLVVLGVTGSIAAYKSPEIVRALRAEGAEVQALLTPAATRFVSPLTLRTLTTWVTSSSEVALTRSGRSLPGRVREFASGMILTVLPEGTATKPWTCSSAWKA